jgi:hypothetical protein
MRIGDDDTSGSEGRFGHRPGEKYSRWASVLAVAITIVNVGLVIYYRAVLVAL